MKIVLTVTFAIIIGSFISVLGLASKVDALKDRVVELESYINTSNDMAISRENSLQDSLEERIGTVERDLDGIKFILGGGK